ncbi:hypothetical protein GC163_08365 [bacterium]|nr:hypothetical protein [bacterium]
MSPRLTPEQHEAVAAEPGRVVYFIDAITNEQFAVIPKKTFEQLQALFDPTEELNPADFLPAVDEAWRPILEDTALDVYAADVSSPPQP